MALAHVANGKDVTTAGTAEPLTAALTRAAWVTVQSKAANTGKVYIGDSTVSSASFGVELSAAGDSFSFPVMMGQNLHNLTRIFIDVDTDGEGVTVLFGIH